MSAQNTRHKCCMASFFNNFDIATKRKRKTCMKRASTSKLIRIQNQFFFSQQDGKDLLKISDSGTNMTRKNLTYFRQVPEDCWRQTRRLVEISCFLFWGRTFLCCFQIRSLWMSLPVKVLYLKQIWSFTQRRSCTSLIVILMKRVWGGGEKIKTNCSISS